jgi:peptidoglycan-associated lipoprotein
MKSFSGVLLAVAVFAIAACNKSNTLPDAGSETVANTGSNTGASTESTGSGSTISVSPLEAERQRLLGTLVVYFDYDEAEIRPEFNALLQAHGQNLAMNANAQVRLEGHADERGSREYNIGLGERRAQAVRRVLMLQGATANQISTVSYGEERPAATGSDEESWRLNRRVELVYR